jgi:6,7-dimethyl-8-ribityllumazine synthase
MAMKPIEGKVDAGKNRVVIVVSRFNDLIGQSLLKGAVETLRQRGMAEKDIELAWVPGAWEIPVVMNKFMKTGKFQGGIALGAVIRGETTHHEHIAAEVARGLGEITRETGRPVAFGVLTTDTLDQALARAGEKSGNKGAEAALHLLETMSVLEQIQ